MADVYFWLGDATETTATVCVRSDTAGTLTLTGGTNDGPLAVNPATQFGIVKFTVSGLAADTQYSFTLLMDGVAVGNGTIRTFPADGEFNIGWGSCAGSLTPHAWGFQAILDHDIRAFFALGDTPYCDASLSSAIIDGVAQRRWSLGAAAGGLYSEWSTAGRAAFDKIYDDFQRVPGWAYVTERAPLYRMPDDHEYGDDWDWTFTNIKNNVTGKGFVLAGAPLTSQADADTCGRYANAAFGSWGIGNPNPDVDALGWKPSACADTIADHPAQYFSKVIGNVEVFMIFGIAHRDPWPKKDTKWTVCVNRPDNASLGYSYSDPAGAALAKTMLGPNQLNWLLDKLKASTSTFKIIMSGPMPTVMNANINGGLGPNNAWEQWQTEMDYMRAFIKQNVTGVMWCTGDAHVPSVINDSVNDYCCLNSSPLAQIYYIGSSGTYFYRPGYANGCIWRGEPISSSTEPGAKKNAYGIVRVTPTYLQPSIYDENGTLLWTGYLMAGKNVLQTTADFGAGEFA